MSATNGTNGHTRRRLKPPPLTDKAAKLQQRLEEARLESQAIAAERSLRRVKEASVFDLDWPNRWLDVMSQRQGDWVPLNNPSARRYGTNFPFWQTEQEQAQLRDLSRIVVVINNHAWGMLRGLRSFVIGTGMKFKVAGRLDDQKAGGQAAKRVTAWLDLWAKKARWYERQREMFWRTHRDGDAFLRTFADDGWLALRYVWPEQVIIPPGERFEDWGFGVQADPDDAEDVKAVHVAKITNPGVRGDIVPIEEVLHLKANVDTGIKRGCPDFSFGTKDVLDAAARLTRNLGEGAAARAAIAYIRQHGGATQEEVQEFITANATYKERVPIKDNYRDVTNLPPATVVDVSEGMEHAGAPTDPGTEGNAAVVGVLLRSAGTRWNAPEWLVSGDASNMGAFTSSLVAESPFVRSIQEAQDYYRTRFLEVVDAAMACGYAHGVGLREEDVDAVTVELVPPTPEVRDKLKEAQTASIEISLGTESRQRYCSGQGRDYDQIAQENQEHEDAYGSAGEPLPVPGEGAPTHGVPEPPVPFGK